jgi:hypothetical protein
MKRKERRKRMAIDISRGMLRAVDKSRKKKNRRKRRKIDGKSRDATLRFIDDTLGNFSLFSLSVLDTFGPESR